MPAKGSKKKTSKSPTRKSNAANKEDLDGLDELLADPTLMKQFEDKTVPPAKKKTGAENARIGMEGFSQATKNPAMFAEAMSMLSDPNAVKEAQSMMEDPEFKREIQRHMASLKMDPSFQEAMQTAQSKFQELMQDPEKLQQLQAQVQENGLAALAAAPPADADAAGGAPVSALADPGIDEESTT